MWLFIRFFMWVVWVISWVQDPQYFCREFSKSKELISLFCPLDPLLGKEFEKYIQLLQRLYFSSCHRLLWQICDFIKNILVWNSFISTKCLWLFPGFYIDGGINSQSCADDIFVSEDHDWSEVFCFVCLLFEIYLLYFVCFKSSVEVGQSEREGDHRSDRDL